jgi:hypothetical protein
MVSMISPGLYGVLSKTIYALDLPAYLSITSITSYFCPSGMNAHSSTKTKDRRYPMTSTYMMTGYSLNPYVVYNYSCLLAVKYYLMFIIE